MKQEKEIFSPNNIYVAVRNDVTGLWEICQTYYLSEEKTYVPELDQVFCTVDPKTGNVNYTLYTISNGVNIAEIHSLISSIKRIR